MTDLVDLQDALNVMTGQSLDEHQREALLLAGTLMFNADSAQPVTLDGTLVDRDLSHYEQRLMVLYAVLAYMDGEILKASMNAIIHRNDAGRTDLSVIPLRLQQAREDLYTKSIRPLLDAVNGSASAGVLSEVAAVERGETLPYYGQLSYTYPYAYPYWRWPW